MVIGRSTTQPRSYRLDYRRIIRVTVSRHLPSFLSWTTRRGGRPALECDTRALVGAQAEPTGVGPFLQDGSGEGDGLGVGWREAAFEHSGGWRERQLQRVRSAIGDLAAQPQCEIVGIVLNEVDALQRKRGGGEVEDFVRARGRSVARADERGFVRGEAERVILGGGKRGLAPVEHSVEVVVQLVGEGDPGEE